MFWAAAYTSITLRYRYRMLICRMVKYRLIRMELDNKSYQSSSLDVLQSNEWLGVMKHLFRLRSWLNQLAQLLNGFWYNPPLIIFFSIVSTFYSWNWKFRKDFLHFIRLNLYLFSNVAVEIFTCCVFERSNPSNDLPRSLAICYCLSSVEVQHSEV